MSSDGYEELHLLKTVTKTSPCGKYILTMDGWGTKDDGYERVRKWWCKVHTADGRLIGETSRNIYDPSLLSFISQDGVDYLLISENYHGGYGVMNLHTGEKALYSPYDSAKPHQQYWCWVQLATHDPDTKTLKIYGCYWAAPFTFRTYNFSNPMQPPYELLNEEEEPYEDDEDDEAEDA